MKNEAAIDILKAIRTGCGGTAINQALDVAINAIEKQMPKKPEHNSWGQECCPSCGFNAYKDEWGGRYIPHCENCGQAIDWTGVLRERGLAKESEDAE